MGTTIFITANVQHAVFRLSQCPRCANIVPYDDKPRCKAYITRYVFGDEHPSDFQGNRVESDCPKFQDASSHLQFFEAPTTEEAIENATKALGEELAKKLCLFVVRNDSGCGTIGSGIRVRAEADTLAEAISQAKAKIPSEATGVKLSLTEADLSGPESGAFEVRAEDDPKSYPWRLDSEECGLPEWATIETATQIEPGRGGMFEVEMAEQQEVVENWNRLIKEKRLPGDTQFRFLVPGKKGFLGIGWKKNRVSWCVWPKWRVQWRKRRAAFDFFVPVIVRVSKG